MSAFSTEPGSEPAQHTFPTQPMTVEANGNGYLPGTNNSSGEMANGFLPVGNHSSGQLGGPLTYGRIVTSGFQAAPVAGAEAPHFERPSTGSTVRVVVHSANTKPYLRRTTRGVRVCSLSEIGDKSWVKGERGRDGV